MSRRRRVGERDDGGSEAHLEYLRSIPRLESAWTLTRGASWWDTWQHLFAAKDWETMRRLKAERMRWGLSAVPHGPLAEVPLTMDEARELLDESARVAALRLDSDERVHQLSEYRSGARGDL